MNKRHNRNYYLEDIPLEDAIRQFTAALEPTTALSPVTTELLPLHSSNGRVTGLPIWAKSSSPHYDSAAMDGIAVRSIDTNGATETSPIRLKIGPQAQWVDTGDPLPDGLDAVIKIEVVHEIDKSTIEIRSPVPPYHDVRLLGEDIVATELVLPEGHILRPQDLAACAQAGLVEIPVRRRPKILIIPTGSELVDIGSIPKPGDIIESNSLMLSAMIEEWGGLPERLQSIPDNRTQLSAALMSALNKSDIVIINAGSSAGSEDYTAQLIKDIGDVVIHGVAIKPGHPVILGLVDGKPVIGIPGYPVSAAITAEIFVKPLIEYQLGLSPQKRETVKAIVTRKIQSQSGEDEYLRVRLGRVGKRMMATPIQRGAGVIMSLVRADGLAISPRLSEGFEAGTEIDVQLLRKRDQLESTIVVTGSHDVAIDLLASELHKNHPDKSIASSNIGSLGGLMALNRAEAHIAGCHLMDQETGEYNIPFVHTYMRGIPSVVVNLTHRVQGLIVKKGNPKAVKSLEDLSRQDISFVNRQRGSGTRLLLDHMLKNTNLPNQRIRGYEREEYTHLAVAAAIAGERADCGLGILSAARALKLDFIPLGTEQYDFVIPGEFYDGELILPLLDLIHSKKFRQQIDALGGYDTADTGKVIADLR